MLHFKTSNNARNRGLTKTDVDNEETWANPFQHSVWTQDEVDSVRVTHREVQSTSDKIAYNAVQLARWLALSCDSMTCVCPPAFNSDPYSTPRLAGHLTSFRATTHTS